MERRGPVATALVAALALLAGCSGSAEYIDLQPEVVSAAATADGWALEVSVRADPSEVGYTWQDVTVTGHGVEGDRLCTLQLGAVDEDTTATGTLRCDRAPVVVAVRSATLDGRVDADHETGFGEWVYRDGETDSYLETRSLALTNVSSGVPRYTEVPRLAGGVSEFEVSAYGYARCELLSGGVGQSALPSAPEWLDRNVALDESPVATRVTVAPRTASSDPAALVDALDGAEPLRDALAAYPDRLGTDSTAALVPLDTARDGDGAGVGYRYTGDRAALESLRRTLLGPSEARATDVDLTEVPDFAATDRVPYATGTERLPTPVREVDCSRRGRLASGAVENGTTTVAYGLRAGGQNWTVTVTSAYGAATLPS